MSGFFLPISTAAPTCMLTKHSKAPPKKSDRKAAFRLDLQCEQQLINRNFAFLGR